DLGEAAAMIESTGRGTVCVVRDGELAGILTERDILEAVAGGVAVEGA
ncbi:MAG: CBS domain-containing protein, partial [Euryarchaeota archaeon]|nr:CBS domain-containing protein [Euryarchaeota archaeon]